MRKEGTDRRPKLTRARAKAWSRASVRTAFRKVSEVLLSGGDEIGGAGRIHDVLVGGEDPFLGIAVGRLSGALPSITNGLPAQGCRCPGCGMAPRAPKGETWWATSPTNSVRRGGSSACAGTGRCEQLTHSSSNSRSSPSMALMRGMTLSGFFFLRDRPASRAGSRCARRCRPGGGRTDCPGVEGGRPEPALGGKVGLRDHVGDEGSGP